MAPRDPTTLPFSAAQAAIDAIWSDMDLRYPPAVAPLPRQSRSTIARADRLSILLADLTPSWCLLHELARYLRLDPLMLINSLRDAKIKILCDARPVFVDG